MTQRRAVRFHTFTPPRILATYSGDLASIIESESIKAPRCRYCWYLYGDPQCHHMLWTFAGYAYVDDGL